MNTIKTLTLHAALGMLLLTFGCGDGGLSVANPPMDEGPDNTPDVEDPDNPMEPDPMVPDPEAPSPDPVNPDPDTPTPDVEDPEDCLSDEDFFVERVWQPVLSTQCAGCHIEGGVAGMTRLRLTQPGSDDWIERNLEALTLVSMAEVDGTPLLLVKPTGAHEDGHTGGAPIVTDSPEYDALAIMAARLRGEADDCDDPDQMMGGDCEVLSPGPRLLRRLTRVEYKNTVHDLLGLDVNVRDSLAADSVVHGFDNNAESLQVSPLLADQYRTLAESLAQEADLTPIVPCALRTGGPICAAAFVSGFGLKAFRRPLTDEDKARYMAIYELSSAEDTFEEGIRWVIVAMLQSPHFLYRTELGSRDGEGFSLTAWEIAAELSYLIWGSMPDAQLFEAAATGALDSAEGIEAEARRLLDDPRSASVVTGFANQWLGLDQLEIVTRDPDLYPVLNQALRRDMAEETARFIQGLWTEGAALPDLFLSTHTHLNDALAEHYGVDAGPGSGFREVDMSGTPYTGLLTHASLLTTHALPTGSSPIHRGMFVREKLLCQELPPPPANLDTSPPPVDTTRSTRERYAQHAADPACSGCHTLLDPIGFAFEHFDAIGQWRTEDNGHPIDDSGFIVHSAATDGEFDGVDGLSALLADSPDVSRCYVEQWLRFGYGLSDSLDVECYVDVLQEDFEAEDQALGAVLLALTRSPHFSTREGGQDEGDVPGVGAIPDPDPGIIEPENEGPPSAGITYTYTEPSGRWETGYCADVTVTNEDDAPVVWTIEFEVDGEINNIWNAVPETNSSRVRFSGVEWNGTLDPGASTTFGFCATL